MTASEQAAAKGGAHRAGARRPGRRRRGLQPEPPGGRQVAPHRPGDRPHLPRADHQLARPGHHRPQPGPQPSRPRRSPSCTAPTAAAPPTSSATTCPASTRPGRPRSAPARRLTGRSGKGPKATAVWPQRCMSTPFSIGYVEQAYSRGLLAAFRRNPQPGWLLRHPVHPVPPSLAAAAQKPGITPTDFRSSTSPAPAATPSAGYSWALALRQPAQPRPPGRHSSACWTGSPTTVRPTPPRTATCPCQPRSSNWPALCSTVRRPHRDTPPRLTVPGLRTEAPGKPGGGWCQAGQVAGLPWKGQSQRPGPGPLARCVRRDGISAERLR